MALEDDEDVQRRKETFLEQERIRRESRVKVVKDNDEPRAEDTGGNTSEEEVLRATPHHSRTGPPYCCEQRAPWKPPPVQCLAGATHAQRQ